MYTSCSTSVLDQSQAVKQLGRGDTCNKLERLSNKTTELLRVWHLNIGHLDYMVLCGLRQVLQSALIVVGRFQQGGIFKQGVLTL